MQRRKVLKRKKMIGCKRRFSRSLHGKGGRGHFLERRKSFSREDKRGTEEFEGSKEVGEV